MANEVKTEPTDVADYPFDLGSFGRKVSTSSTAAQAWFNRGLTWTYAFNHMEAVNCFEKAIAHDSQCAMAYWGIAFASGPNYNKPWELFDEHDLRHTLQTTSEAASTAQALASSVTPIEQGLIKSIQIRFPGPHLVSLEQLKSQSRAYADAMAAVYKEFSNDLDVATFYADAMMTLTPWKLYDVFTGEPTEEGRAVESQQVLEHALKLDGATKHPGLLHMYIHLSEMSPNPERGLSAADCLRDLIPDAGHTHHMPVHLDILVGDYRRAISSNTHSTLADEKYLAVAGPNNFYTLYRMHNYHSLIYAAMFAGRKQVAMDTVDRMESSLPEDVLRVKSPSMADWLENFMAVRLHVMVRFGLWEDIIQMTPQRIKTTTHYAKGVAWASLRNMQEAERERDLFRAAVERVPHTRRMHPNKSLDILRVGSAMLDGEIEYRQGNYQQAFADLQKAIEFEDSLTFSEPWGWMQPVRHAFAALKLEQGHVEEAAEAYKDDLGLNDTRARAHHHPNNVWALQGYYECLVRLGRTVEAVLIAPQVKIALAVADVPVQSSCFCRLDTSCVPNVCEPECPKTSKESCCRA
ncbi:hypothetical protein N7517_010879 [Penicillium concentricum]|uniref:TPR domain protein n=1 Tax=Penicillium concentricum TaxID=293559 RepID=A0A9W9R9N6_9EURO|nr:uncharacterized protein N7517_010879 [Penicillium concentricum]KAJ5356270.1 hypothetical protein N7517_010879 [Penicillium concentricum]